MFFIEKRVQYVLVFAYWIAILQQPLLICSPCCNLSSWLRKGWGCHGAQKYQQVRWQLQKRGREHASNCAGEGHICKVGVPYFESMLFILSHYGKSPPTSKDFTSSWRLNKHVTAFNPETNLQPKMLFSVHRQYVCCIRLLWSDDPRLDSVHVAAFIGMFSFESLK